MMSAPSVPDAPLACAIRVERKRMGVTQEELAHRAGLTVAAFARIERGHANPMWTTVRDIARALCIDVAVLALHADELR